MSQAQIALTDENKDQFVAVLAQLLDGSSASLRTLEELAAIVDENNVRFDLAFDTRAGTFLAVPTARTGLLSVLRKIGTPEARDIALEISRNASEFVEAYELGTFLLEREELEEFRDDVVHICGAAVSQLTDAVLGGPGSQSAGRVYLYGQELALIRKLGATEVLLPEIRALTEVPSSMSEDWLCLAATELPPPVASKFLFEIYKSREADAPDDAAWFTALGVLFEERGDVVAAQYREASEVERAATVGGMLASLGIVASNMTMTDPWAKHGTPVGNSKARIAAALEVLKEFSSASQDSASQEAVQDAIRQIETRYP